MSLLSTLLVTLGRVLTYVQLILYLPLALDLAGQDCFNALSASLAVYYFLLSTIRLLTKRTKWSWLGSFLSIFQFIVVPACLLISFNFYSPPENSYFGNNYRSGSISGPDSGGSNAARTENAGSMAFSFFRSKSSSSPSTYNPPFTSTTTTTTSSRDAVYDHQYTRNQTLNLILSFLLSFVWWALTNIPTWWSTLLRISSPLFSLLEGISTLLVIQSLGSTSRWIIARSLSSPPPPPNRRRLLSYFPSFGLGGAEGWQLLFLVLSAFIYVFSALALYLSFEGATKGSAGIAAAVGVSISSTFWLTAIAFGVRKGNVVETSLMLAYVVFNVCTLDSLSFTALEDPLTLIRSFKVESLSTSSYNSPATNLFVMKSSLFLSPFVIDAITSLIKVIKLVLGQSLSFISAAGNALPKSVIVSLIYRLTILYASSRILPGLKKSVENSGRDGSLSRSSSQVNLKLNGEGSPDHGLEGAIKEKSPELGRRPSLKEESESESESDSESSSSVSDSSSSDSDSGSDEEEGMGSRTKKIRNHRHSRSKSSRSRPKRHSRSNRKSKRSRRNKYSDSEESSSSSSISTSTTSSTSTDSTTSSSTESEALKAERRKKWRRQSLLKKQNKSRSRRARDGNSIKTLREEESFGTFISIIVSYSRLILIAVYSHLLMLDQSHKVYWRFLTIGITLSLWSMELILGREDSELGFK